MSRNKPILCVDFDGVVHSYTSPWINEVTIPDPPVPGALEWLWKATEWFNVVIYSRRSRTEAGRMAMKLWLMEHSKHVFIEDHPMIAGGLPDSVYPIDFAAEKPAAFLTIDDRAVTFEGDWSELDPCAMLGFKPWNKRGVPIRLAPYKS